MKILFAGDHAGFEMKKELAAFVRSLGHDVDDLGPYSYDSHDDYPDYVAPLARAVVQADGAYLSNRSDMSNQSNRTVSGSRGIVVAGSGQGEIIVMNRIRGARAALLCPGSQELSLLRASREHNDSNILAIGARFVSLNEAKQGIRVWLETPFSGDERHIRRLKKIDG